VIDALKFLLSEWGVTWGCRAPFGCELPRVGR